MKLERDDAPMWGRFAYDLGLTLVETLTQARSVGMPERWLPDVERAWRQAAESAAAAM